MNRRKPLGLYVHIPFCAVKCYYCDFAAFSGKRGQIDRYLEALRRESAFYNASPDTLYIGGGTPSELSAAQLARLLEILAESCGRGGLRGLYESTIEVNPESADGGKIDLLARAGISRISIGLESAHDRILALLGRRHTWKDFLRVYRAARAAGLEVNVDLMCGLPGQSPPDAARSMSRVLDLEPDHVSVYGLSVEDRTLFKKRSVKVDEDRSREMLAAAHALLKAAGLRHYEISNFARPGAASLHNINYWRNGAYVGLGCGAAGHLGGVRYQNETVLERYLARVEKGEKPVAGAEKLEGKERYGETILLGLRLMDGVPLAPRMSSAFRGEIEKLLERGLVAYVGVGCSRRPPRLRLTGEGVMLANKVFEEFVAPFA